MTTPNFTPPGGSTGGMDTWRKVAVGCGGLAVLGVLLFVTLLVGIAIGARTGEQQNARPTPPPPTSTEPTPADEEGTATVLVRVTGTEGLKFTGNIGTLDGSRSVEGTVPQEYEVQVETGPLDFDSVRAYFSRDFLDETDGTLGVEIVYEGKVVKQSETSAQAGSVSVNWSPGE